MAVDTSVAPLVPGPRTPYALYPELSSEPSCEHKGFLWRAGYKRNSDPGGRYTSEYQRQYQPISAEGHKELTNSRKERRDMAPVADMREVLKEVEGAREAPEIPVPDKPLEVSGGQKRSAKKSEKRAAKRPKKDRPPPFPLSEYQAQFQSWDLLVKQNTSNSPVREINKQTPFPLPPSYSIQHSPRRWSSEYRSNFSLRSSDATQKTSPWYQMVVELRERARAYRDRGRSSALEVLQLPLSRRYSEVSDSSRPLPSPPPTAERTPDPEPAVDTRDSATQVSVRPRKQKSAVNQLGGSFTKLKVSVPTNQLLEDPNRPFSNTLAASRECPHEAVRARTAVPPIDINRVRSYPSPLPPPSCATQPYPPAPVPPSGLCQTDPSLQAQLFRYKEGASPPDPDQLSVASTESLASHTLDRARYRQTFWK